MTNRSRSILVVDDSAVLRNVLMQQLAGKGFEVFSVRDGAEAMLWVDRNPTADVVITDFHMPNMDGVGLIRGLRSHPRYRTVPILVLTVGADAGEKQEARLAGATGWIIKPFDTDKLVTAIHQIVH